MACSASRHCSEAPPDRTRAGRVASPRHWLPFCRCARARGLRARSDVTSRGAKAGREQGHRGRRNRLTGPVAPHPGPRASFHGHAVGRQGPAASQAPRTDWLMCCCGGRCSGQPREVARRLGRAPSTISRELRRNTLRHDVGGYDGDLAHARARAAGTPSPRRPVGHRCRPACGRPGEVGVGVES